MTPGEIHGHALAALRQGAGVAELHAAVEAAAAQYAADPVDPADPLPLARQFAPRARWVRTRVWADCYVGNESEGWGGCATVNAVRQSLEIRVGDYRDREGMRLGIGLGDVDAAVAEAHRWLTRRAAYAGQGTACQRRAMASRALAAALWPLA